MQKRHDWLSALHAHLESVRATPFGYGTNDCALFTAGAVAAMTGEDPAAAFRGKYRTRIGGLRKIRAAGYADQIDFVAKNFREIQPAFASVGDVVVLNVGALGVHVGDRVAVAGADGLSFCPVADVARAFSIERGAA